MSWDVFVFNSKQKIETVEDLDESLLVDIGTWQEFKRLIENQFSNAVFDGNWCTIGGKDFSLETSLGPPDEKVDNTIFHLHGNEAIYPLMALCQNNNWQAFDNSLEDMLNLDKPEQNGYSKFAAYLAQIKQHN